MFSRSFRGFNCCKKYLYCSANKIVKINNLRTLSGFSNRISSKDTVSTLPPRICRTRCNGSQVPRRYLSSSVLDGDIHTQKERDLTGVSHIFPNPRVTLNEFATRAPSKVFDIHYRQSNTAPKGSKKKGAAATSDWTCTYEFVWPETIKFEGTERSKWRAAEKAALLALHWLYTNKRMDNKGFPVYDQAVIKELSRSMQEPIRASISDQSMERVEKIWDRYENEIKIIYERTFTEAKQRWRTPAAVVKDSSLDEEDEYSEENSVSNNDSGDLSESPVPVHPVYGRHVPPPSETALEKRKRQLARTLSLYDEQRTPLPIDDYMGVIASTIARHQATVVAGAAGCGKSTRAPLAPLRAGAGAVIVAGPRRVAAVGLARRVAAELGEQVGGTVGYQVRLDSQPPRPPCGSVLYCTSGVLLRRLQSNPGLEGCTHVFIDEAHERDVNTDLCLLLLKRALLLNPQLRVVVMSATLDIEVFSKYFDSCPVIEVPGRTFPVETTYLYDVRRKYNLELPDTVENCSRDGEKPLLVHCKEIVEVIKAIDKREPEGAILVFLPGWAEIKQTMTLLQQCGNSTHLVLPVHSRLSTADQAKMFATPIPGIRKIVLATNIAETSVTIPDVVHVVDSGLHKEARTREGSGTSSLQMSWVSLAAARQRAGRAGRIRAGHCYKLYTQEKENEFEPYATPEILRVPLEQTVLNCKTYAPEEKVEDFLSQLPESPTREAIHLAVDDLIDLGALSASEQLTRLGSLLSSLPLSPGAARALLAGAVLSCAGAAARALAGAAAADLFDNAADRRAEIREIKRQFSPTSDHAALCRIQEEFDRIIRERGLKEAVSWCQRYGLISERLSYLRAISNLYLEHLLKSPVMQPSPEVHEWDRFSPVDELVGVVLLCGPNKLLVPKPRLRTKGKLRAELTLVTSRGSRAQLSSESVNRDVTRSLLVHSGGLHSAARRALLVRDATLVAPLAVTALSPGTARVLETYEDTTVLQLPKHNVQIHVPTSQINHFLWIKEMFANTFQYYVERDPNSVTYEENTTVSRFKVKLIKTITSLLDEANTENENKNTGYVDEFR